MSFHVIPNLYYFSFVEHKIFEKLSYIDSIIVFWTPLTFGQKIFFRISFVCHGEWISNSFVHFRVNYFFQCPGHILGDNAMKDRMKVRKNILMAFWHLIKTTRTAFSCLTPEQQKTISAAPNNSKDMFVQSFLNIQIMHRTTDDIYDHFWFTLTFSLPFTGSWNF